MSWSHDFIARHETLDVVLSLTNWLMKTSPSFLLC